MIQGPRLLALCAMPLVSASISLGCGDYSQPDQPGGSGAGGTGGSTGGSAAGSGGSAAGSGGAGGSVGGAAGSGAGAGGTAGSDAGAAGTAGSGAGTGGSAGGGPTLTCDDAVPCGGDLVGTWTVGDCAPSVTGGVDLQSIGLPVVCVSAPITMGSLEITGTLTLNMDGSYADATTTTGEIVFEFPPECLELSGTTTTCEGISGPLLSKGFVANTCVDNSETMGCTCTGTVQQTGSLAFISYDYAESGTYEVTGNAVAMSSFDEDVEYSFCVSGSTLGVTLESVSNTGTVAGAILLTKM